MRILFFGNGGSGNHGCEAIVRGTVQLLEKTKSTFTIHSANCNEDTKYGLDKLAKILPSKEGYRKNISFLKAYLKLKILHDYVDLDGLAYQKALKTAKGNTDIALAVGGDNYCYNGTEIYAFLNKAYQAIGAKTVLWGCSIEPEVVKQEKVAQDLKKYALINTRESITYEAVKEVNENVILTPDPAFIMDIKKCFIDKRLEGKAVVGVNISPHIIKCENVKGMAYKNYVELIKYILENTDKNIALIPHVVWDTNDDRQVLRELYEDFECDERLILVEDHTAPELKYIISKCEVFVGARTHATIAAYSSCVPTLVVGYSVKARGIAKDLFGTEENYVLPVQDLAQQDDLVTSFRWVYDRREEIKKHLETIMPEYIKTGQKAVEALWALKG